LDAGAAESRPGMSWLARLGRGRWFDGMEKRESGRAGELGMAVLLCMGEGLFCDDRLWFRIGRV